MIAKLLTKQKAKATQPQLPAEDPVTDSDETSGGETNPSCVDSKGFFPKDYQLTIEVRGLVNSMLSFPRRELRRLMDQNCLR